MSQVTMRIPLDSAVGLMWASVWIHCQAASFSDVIWDNWCCYLNELGHFSHIQADSKVSSIPTMFISRVLRHMVLLLLLLTYDLMFFILRSLWMYHTTIRDKHMTMKSSGSLLTKWLWVFYNNLICCGSSNSCWKMCTYTHRSIIEKYIHHMHV